MMGKKRKRSISVDAGRKRSSGADSSKASIEQRSSMEMTSKKSNLQNSSKMLKHLVTDIYRTTMPQDFYDFWELCLSIKPDNPKEAFKDPLQLELCGPYDCMTGDVDNPLLHCRYWYDPPEFTTVIRSPSLHFGYFRDDPSELPAFVAMNNEKRSHEFRKCGENLFAAVKFFIAVTQADSGQSGRSRFNGLYDQVVKYAKEKGYSILALTNNMKKRDKTVNCPLFHTLGLVVPLDKNGNGYRCLEKSKERLVETFRKVVEKDNQAIEQLHDILSSCQFANDECDYGCSLEIGLNMFIYGDERLHPYIFAILPTAYRLINRAFYAQIIELHLANRKRLSK